MKKLCIFDFDGTMFDSLTDVVKCFDKTFEYLGYEKLDLDFYKKSLGGNVDEIISLLLKDNNNPKNIELVKSTFEKIYNKDLKENTKLYDGILDLLEQLQKQDYILAINSNRDPKSITEFINMYAGDINFIDIQGHVYTNPSKPNPYGVNTIMSKANVSNEDTIYIGDSITDIKTAKNANIDCLLVRWGYGVGDVYENEYPIAIAEKTEDILNILNNC